MERAESCCELLERRAEPRKIRSAERAMGAVEPLGVGLSRRRRRRQRPDRDGASELLGLPDALGRARLQARRRRAYPLEELDAVDEVHREEPLAGGGDEIAKHDEVRVSEIRESAELALESTNRRGVAVAEPLERDVGVALRVEGREDDTEAAPSEAVFDLEAAAFCERGVQLQIHVIVRHSPQGPGGEATRRARPTTRGYRPGAARPAPLIPPTCAAAQGCPVQQSAVAGTTPSRFEERR